MTTARQLTLSPMHQEFNGQIMEEPTLTANSTNVAADSTFVEHTWKTVQSAIQGDPQAITEILSKFVAPAVESLGILFAFYFAGKFASRWISIPISKRVDATLGRFVEKLVFRGTVGCGALFVLNHFGIRSTSFAAVLAAMGFAIGLAFQGTLSNFASGILLMIFRPFKVGDLVVTNGITAKVYEIDLFATAVDTPDNRRLIIPNSAISGHTIENVTFHPLRRVEVPVGIAYSANLDATRSALNQAIVAIRESIVENDDRVSQVLLVGFGPSAIDWLVRVWAPTPEFAVVRDKLVYAIKNELDSCSIPIAFPQLDIHVDKQFLDVLEQNAIARRQAPRRIPASSTEAA